MKFTKTATFIFPLLGIQKNLFYCNIKSLGGYTKHTLRFINAYLSNPDVPNYNYKDYVSIVVKNYRDVDFDAFYNTMISYPNYIDDYEVANCLVLVYKVPDEFVADYQCIMTGKYSEVSVEGKRLILANNFYSGKPMTLPLILHKAESLRVSWEEKLGCSLGDQEVWPIINLENEVLCKYELKSLSSTRTTLSPLEGQF